ncbi:MAG: Crp/Fnr family transcriptional regulator [Deltaproteobacteria bacterium]|nr:Crp/Fnr family transcriptional regulator [Deltaproteobacteria bacterium]
MALSILTALELFRGISEQESQTIARLCAERRFRRGATIFAKGDPADALYILKDRLVRLVARAGSGAETILHILCPGAIFGELLLSEEKRAFTAVAGTDVLVTVIPKTSFIELLAAVPRVSGNFIRMLSRRLSKVEKEFAGFGHTWSYHRLAKVLLELAEEHGVKTPEGTALSLKLTHEDLANMIGTTRETVTTQFNRFRKKRLLRREGRALVPDVPRLKAFVRERESRVGEA